METVSESSIGLCRSKRAQCSAAEKLSTIIESKEATIFPEQYPDVAEFLQHISGSSLTRALHNEYTMFDVQAADIIHVSVLQLSAVSTRL